MAPRRSKNEPQGVRAVERALDILQCFGPDRPSMSVLEIQSRVRLSRPTLYRLLTTLQSRGLIRAHGDPQRFSLDYGLGRLAHNWMSGIDPIRLGRPAVQRLLERTNETAALFILQGEQRLCVLELPALHFLKISRGVGETEHITSGASGKAILAFLNSLEAEAILRSLGDPNKIAKVKRDLKNVQTTGYAISRGEVFAGAVAIAAPYFDHRGAVLGSVGTFGPAARLDAAWERAAIIAVATAADEISAALGYKAAQSSKSIVASR